MPSKTPPDSTLSGNQPEGRVFRLCGKSGQFAARDTLEQLTCELRRWEYSDDFLGVVELVTAEALNNVMEHACRGRDGICYRLEASDRDGRLFLQVEDHGDAMPGLKLPSGASEDAPLPDVDVPTADLPEGGWGWNLIKTLSEKLAYQREDDVNRLIIEIRQ